MKNRIPLLILCACLVSLATATTAMGAACYTPWVSTTAYNGGATVSYASVNYTANWWTQGNEPDKNNGGPGSGQPWTSNGACGGGSTATATKTATATGSKTATATATKTATATATKTATKTATATATKTATPCQSNCGGGGGKQFAPYVDMSMSNNNLSSIASASGIKTFTAAFVVSYGCKATWFGIPTYEIPGETIVGPIITPYGIGNVIISFGGASGEELAQACVTAAATQAQYQAVINAYGAKSLDFDIEGALIAYTTVVDVRNAALASLQSANSGLQISYTLPVMPTGLTQDGVNLLTNTKSHNVNVSVVNVMAMDYGGADGSMGQDAINATVATHAQVQAAGLSANMGCTPMIGQNDSSGEIFSLADAQTLVNWANGTSYVSRLAFWSVGRDNGGCAGSGSASPSCSGVSQSNYQFSGIFKGF